MHIKTFLERLAIAAVAAFAAATVLAEPFSKTYTVPLTGDVFVETQPDNGNYLLMYAGDMFNRSTNSAFFAIPQLDPNKFTITNVVITFNGILGGAVWGPHSINGSLAAQIDTEAFITAGPVYWDDPREKDVPPQAPSDSLWVHYNQTVAYNSTNWPPDIAYFYTNNDSSFSSNGFLKVPTVVHAKAQAEVWEPEEHHAGGTTVFWGDIHVDVRYSGETIGNATVADLPPDPVVNSDLVFQQELGDLNTLIPAETDLPDSVRNALTMRITNMQVTNNDVNLSWHTVGGQTNYVQVSSDLVNFADFSGPIVVSNTNVMVTANYTDVGGRTNGSTRFYRIRQDP